MSQSTLPTLDNANLLGQGFDIFGPYTVDSLLKPLFDAGDKTHVIRVGQQDYLAPLYVNSFKILRSDSVSESGVTREEFQQSIAANANVSTSYGAFSGHMELAFSRQVAHSSEYMFAYKSFYDGENELQLDPGMAMDYRERYFVAAIEQLPSTVNSENLHLFADFFGTFGTHYTRRVRLGASLEFYVAVSKTSTDNAQQVGALMQAHYRGLFVKGSLSTELTNSQVWKSYISTSRITVNVLGGSVETRGPLQGIAEKDPTPDTVSAYDKWFESINENTTAVNFRLGPIWELCGDKASVVQQAWMQFGPIMHPQLSMNTWSPPKSVPLVDLSGKGQIIPAEPAEYNCGCMVAILDRTNLLGPDSVKFAKYYSMRPSLWPETYLNMYDQVAKGIRASSFNNQNYALIFVTMGLDWNCVPSSDLAGLLLSAGAGQQLKNWIKDANSGVQSNESANYILVSFFNQGQSRGFEQLDHGAAYANVASQLRVYFYRPSITGGLYTLGLSPFPTAVSETPAHQERADTTHHVQSGRYITHKSEKTPEEILAYWTPERIAQAQPAPIPEIPRGHREHPAQTTSREQIGEASTTEQRKASHHQKQHGVEAYQTVKITVPTIYDLPYRCVGKLFFTMDGRNYVASASVAAENGLITAAHCLYNYSTKQWADNVKFCPAYTAGSSAKFGSWAYRGYAVPWEWQAEELKDHPRKRMCFDVGLVELFVGGNERRPIATVVGQLPIIVDQRPDDLEWLTAGYPVRPPADGSYPFNGQDMWECWGGFLEYFDDRIDKEGNLTAGSSGGPWLVIDNATEKYYINGVQSTGTLSEDADISPYFSGWVSHFYARFFPK